MAEQGSNRVNAIHFYIESKHIMPEQRRISANETPLRSIDVDSMLIKGSVYDGYMKP